jgi:translation initiation factor IF-3
MARQRDLDLVEVAANAMPPVCKLLDYGRFKYEQTKKEREAKKHQHATELKELRLRPGTDDHDVDVRARSARRFIEEGHKVRLLVRFRGREAAHPEIARNQIDRIVKSLQDIAIVEQGPMMEGPFALGCGRCRAWTRAPAGQSSNRRHAAISMVRGPLARACTACNKQPRQARCPGEAASISGRCPVRCPVRSSRKTAGLVRPPERRLPLCRCAYARSIASVCSSVLIRPNIFIATFIAHSWDSLLPP